MKVFIAQTVNMSALKVTGGVDQSVNIFEVVQNLIYVYSQTGNQSISIEPGPYTFLIGNKTTFGIDIASDGNVISSNSDAATGGLGTLTFNPTFPR